MIAGRMGVVLVVERKVSLPGQRKGKCGDILRDKSILILHDDFTAIIKHTSLGSSSLLKQRDMPPANSMDVAAAISSPGEGLVGDPEQTSEPKMTRLGARLQQNRNRLSPVTEIRTLGEISQEDVVEFGAVVIDNLESYLLWERANGLPDETEMIIKYLDSALTELLTEARLLWPTEVDRGTSDFVVLGGLLLISIVIEEGKMDF